MSLHLVKSLEIDTSLESDVLNAALHHAGYNGHLEGLLPKRKHNGEESRLPAYESKLCIPKV